MSADMPEGPSRGPQRRESGPHAAWRARLHEIIFESDTRAGRMFDLALMWAIVASVLVVLLDSIGEVHARYRAVLYALEWGFTVLFTVEYALRLVAVQRPVRYALSFFGIVDLLAILPTYLSLMLVGAESLLVIRALRLLRIFRVLKLGEYLAEARLLSTALRASQRKIIVFLGTVLTIVVIMGAAMYLVEGPEHGYTSIPTSMYWAVVTMTTVGYGDIAPKTPLGQLLASALMILGYAIIAVPTGIVTAEIAFAKRAPVSNQACPSCSAEGHDFDAKHCKFCGATL